ncbi:hypothetical protein WA1_18835 [Scytonema hofmannii PCC 7110]|uniref:Uncharacterized protein n=1 Tax=Scytonema hofmannii PCC 7110 TaxID=128403 RepID=A0A139XBJ4_9CYAN|nr:hypothetical protein [Scytonema hofmannii]KYC42059.1 hypothetical protein WA1_18835 [Scytonema hofmannii PCC 7110]
MISIDFNSPTIDTTYTAHLTEMPEGGYAPLVRIDYGEVEAIAINNPPKIIALPQDLDLVSVIANGQTLTPTVAKTLKYGEYQYDPYTKTVRVFVPGVRSLVLLGKKEQIKYAPPMLPGPYPWLFTRLPLEGNIQIDRDFEQHPRVSFQLESTLSKSQLQQIFTPGTELEIYGLPLRINSIRIVELPRSIYPDSRCKISVSLGGKWENRIEDPVFLRRDGGNSTPNNEPFQDPECSTGVLNSTTDPNNSVSIQELLSRAGIPYSGPTLKPVPIERGTPRDAVVSPSQLLEERLRVANSFVRWSTTSAVEVIPINSTKAWFYQEPDILGEVETSYDAIARPSKRAAIVPNINPIAPDFVYFPSAIQKAPIPTIKSEIPTALAFEYPNVELTGEFSNPKDDTREKTQGQSQPRYVRKPPTRDTRIDGDLNAHNPPDGVSVIRVMSLCFDLGGSTKTRSYVNQEDGTEVSKVDEIWGFAYTALQIYDDGSDELKGNALQYWKCIKRTRTDYIYDEGTGYLLYIFESGYNTVRWRQESTDSPETLEIEETDEEQELYEFFRIPVTSRSSYRLKLMPEYSSEGLFETYKVCNRDGTSSLRALINPDYAPPYYVEWERTESFAFASRPNPDNEGVEPDSETKLAPDLIVGEESMFEARVEVIPAVYEEKLVGFDNKIPIYEQGVQLYPQKWIKYIKKFKAEGQQIAQALAETSIEQGTGDLPVHQRRVALYAKEEPSQNNSKTESDREQQYKYLIRTPGYTSEDPVNGSEDFPLAKTLEEALTAARCKLAIENWRQGLTETLDIGGNLNIKEGDRFNYYLNGEYRQRVVLGASTTLNILGAIDRKPRLTAVTRLTLGRWMLPQLEYFKIPVNGDPSNPELSVLVINIINENLGQLLDWASVRSRRNPG